MGQIILNYPDEQGIRIRDGLASGATNMVACFRMFLLT